MCEMCDCYLFILLVKLIKFFSLSFFILLPVMVNKDSLFKSTGTMVTGTRTRSSEVDRRQGGWKILKRTCRKEEVIFARQWNLLKTGRSGRR